MNRALSGAPLAGVPNASRTLLFWQAVTDTTVLPPSAYQKASIGFSGVACDGTAHYLEPTGTSSEPLLWLPAERVHVEPPHPTSIR